MQCHRLLYKLSGAIISAVLRQPTTSNNVKRRILYLFHSSNNYLSSMASNNTNLDQTESRDQRKRNILVVGLCNYDMPNSRHSVGMQVVNKLAAQLGISWKTERKTFGGLVAIHTMTNKYQCVLLKPKLPMNLNGKSVQKTAEHFLIEPEDVYLIHDELDKSVGDFRFKYGGSARGHNGVRSVQQCLKSDVMPRLCVGIDRPASKNQVADYVLGNFTPSQRDVIQQSTSECIKALCNELSKKYGISLLQKIHENDGG